MPGGELSTALVRLTADASEFVTVMNQAGDTMRDFATTVEARLIDVKTAAENLDINFKSLAISGTAVSAIGGAIVGAFGLATESASKFETQVYNLSQRIQLTTEDVSAMALAAESQGRSLDSVEVAFRKLGLEAENAALGQKKAVEVFDAIGVSVKDETGRVKELSELFPEVSQGLANVGDSTIKVGLANDLYGRSSLALLPVLGGGVDKMNEFKAIAEETGVLVTQSQAEQGKAFTLTQMIAENAFKGIEISIGSVLMPALIDLINEIKSNLEWVSSLAKEYPVLTDAVFAVAVGLAGSGGLLTAIAGINVAMTIMQSTMVGLTGGLVVFTGSVGVLSGLAYAFRNDIAEIVTLIGSKLAGALADILGPLATLAGAAGFSGLHDSLMTTKFSLEETSKGWADQSEQFSHTVTAINPLNDQLKLLAAMTKGAGDGHLDAAPKVDVFQNAVNRLIDSVTEEIKTGPVLVAALGAMTLAREDEDSIIIKLGPRIVAYHDELVRGGKTVDALTQYYYDLAVARNTDVFNTERQFDEAVKLGKIFDDNKETLKAYAAENATIRAEMAHIDEQYVRDLNAANQDADTFLKATYNDELKAKIELINNTIAQDNTYASKSRDLATATLATKKDLESAWSDYVFATDYLITMSENGANAEQMKDLQLSVNEKLKTWETYKNELLKLTNETTGESEKYWAHFYTSQDQARQTMEFDMAKAMGNMTADIAGELSKDILSWSGWADSLKKIATDVAGSMLKAFIEGLLNPLTNSLKNLGKTISDTLSGAVGGGGGATGAGLGAALGGLGAVPLIGGAIALGGLIGGLFKGGDPTYTHFYVDQHDGGYPTTYTTPQPMTIAQWNASHPGFTLLGQYEYGTPYVPQTGAYLLHQGEQVVPADGLMNWAGPGYSQNPGKSQWYSPINVGDSSVGADQVASLLSSILNVLQQAGGDLVLNIDGQEIARVVGVNLRYLTYNSGLQLVASR